MRELQELCAWVAPVQQSVPLFTQICMDQGPPPPPPPPPPYKVLSKVNEINDAARSVVQTPASSRSSSMCLSFACCFLVLAIVVSNGVMWA